MAAELCALKEVCVLKVRIKYAKTGVVRFIGHLDVMRYFQKAIRRAGIDITYTKGYSPHQILSFAAPLGLGVTSEGEYFDAELDSLEESKVMVDKMNDAMNDGMKVLDIRLLDDNAKAAMAIVSASDYVVNISDDSLVDNSILSNVEDFINQDSIVILKKSKKTEKEVDIKPFIIKIHYNNNGLYMLLKTGSENNIKPELVVEAICRYKGVEYRIFDYSVHRLETYCYNENNELIPLIDTGKVITNDTIKELTNESHTENTIESPKVNANE